MLLNHIMEKSITICASSIIPLWKKLKTLIVVGTLCWTAIGYSSFILCVFDFTLCSVFSLEGQRYLCNVRGKRGQSLLDRCVHSESDEDGVQRTGERYALGWHKTAQVSQEQDLASLFE